MGAALQFCAQALAVGTTIKLARVLWIVSIAFLIGTMRARNSEQETAAVKGKKLWLILGFLIAASLVTVWPELQPAGHQVESVAKHILVLTLFLIGTNFTRSTSKSVGFKPFIQEFFVWVLMSSAFLTAIIQGWIQP